MWTEITRRKYERDGRRYASDVTDAEWALIEPYMAATKPLGRPRETALRAVLDAILYIARTGSASTGPGCGSSINRTSGAAIGRHSTSAAS